MLMLSFIARKKRENRSELLPCPKTVKRSSCGGCFRRTTRTCKVVSAGEAWRSPRLSLTICTIIIVLRDVAKASDKVWHNGLKYKILRLGLPDILEKTLCNFLDNRKAKTNIGHIPAANLLGPETSHLHYSPLQENVKSQGEAIVTCMGIKQEAGGSLNKIPKKRWGN